MQLLAQKVETWLGLALAETATGQRLRVFQGQESDDNRERPALVIVHSGAVTTPPFLWRDNERTATAEVYIVSDVDERIALHTARCSAVEAAIQAEATVISFATEVDDFFVYGYEVTNAEHEADDTSKARISRYTLSIKCRDDSGTTT